MKLPKPAYAGETITFSITNTAGYAHNFWIGTDQQLMTNQVQGLPGLPDVPCHAVAGPPALCVIAANLGAFGVDERYARGGAVVGVAAAPAGIVDREARWVEQLCRIGAGASGEERRVLQ